MTPSLKTLPKWLFLPPAVALLIVLGPLSMQGGQAAGSPPAAPTTAAPAIEPEPATERTAARPAPAAPRTPDPWQMGGTLLAVLLLGAGGLLLLRKLRGGATPVRGGVPLVTLRQSLRLSARQAVHAIEFDDRILLLGEHDRGLVLLDSGRSPSRDDEGELARRDRAAALAADEDDGAVPRNLVIPRPPARPATPPATPTPPARRPGLNDFRALLQKVGRA
ncbi:MAG: hypothetical protein KF830_05975 [Planctomycetes bacterium]|nr:hypothetical protein [Planctomycetota bacterium]